MAAYAHWRDAAAEGGPRVARARVGSAMDDDRWTCALDRRSEVLRWRHEEGHVLRVDDGIQSVTESLGHTATIGPSFGLRPAPPALRQILAPVELLARFDLGEPRPTTVLGRECASVAGNRRPGQGQDRLPPDPLGGDQVEIVVDVESGMVLTWRCWFDHRLLAEVAIDSLDLDADVDPETFVYSPGPDVEVTTQFESRGQPEVRLETPRGLGGSEDWAAHARDHAPRGPGPDDTTAAEVAIRAAVEGIDEFSADGRDCPNVQGGVGLGLAFEQVARVLGGRRAQFSLRGLRFLTADEAAIFFEVDAGQIHLPVEGRALRIDGRWLIERRTVTQLLRQGGAEIPELGEP